MRNLAIAWLTLSVATSLYTQTAAPPGVHPVTGRRFADVMGADVGAGSGYFTVRLARRVGPAGRVYANDLQPQMLKMLGARLAREGIANVTLVRGVVDDPKLPPSSLDLVLMVDVYHEFSEPQKMLRGLRATLKPGGRLVLLEYRKEDDRLPRQHILIFLTN